MEIPKMGSMVLIGAKDSVESEETKGRKTINKKVEGDVWRAKFSLLCR